MRNLVLKQNRRQLSITLIVVFMLHLVATGFASPAPARGRHAIVASQHPLASQIGVDILKKGGNAVDAAVAVGIALAVVYPEAGNIGGGGFMLIGTKGGDFTSIDYREKAPAAANRNIFIDGSGTKIMGEGSSTTGYRAAGVPGTLAGFEYAFKKYGSGKVSWREVVEPARLLAVNGYNLSQRLAKLAKSSEDRLSRYEDSNRIFMRGGKFYNEGEMFRQPDLASTLGRIQKYGASDFYTGKTARLIADDMQTNNGLISLKDLKDYRPVEREPVRGTYRDYGVVSMPPPSSGGIVLIQILNMLEGYDMPSMPYNAASRYHLVAESMRRAFADRSEYMGDPDFADVPTNELIKKSYAASRRSTIRPEKASSSSEIGFGSPLGDGGMDTTHFSVIDNDGMVVSNTYTINDLYGSAVTVKGTGVLLNDEMDDFAAQPGKPNMYGLVQGERNAVQPGKRPLSSMTPTIVLRKDGSIWFALGARGGPRIITAVLQSALNIMDYNMNIQDAIDAPRVHHQWLPDLLMFEPINMSPDTIRVLAGYGHSLPDEPATLASVVGVLIDEDGYRTGAVDFRSDGLAIGY